MSETPHRCTPTNCAECRRLSDRADENYRRWKDALRQIAVLEGELRYLRKKPLHQPPSRHQPPGPGYHWCNGCGKWLSPNALHACPGRPMRAW